MAEGKPPLVGSDGVLSEGRPLSLHCLPTEVGLRAKPVEYSCIDASQQYLVVGSIQGYVWVIDLQSSRLLREFSEFRGCAITAVKLNPVRDYVAYGTDNGFVRIERLSKVKGRVGGATGLLNKGGREQQASWFSKQQAVEFPQPNKLRVQEKSGQGVTCIEWSQNGDNIFCGFKMGRLVQFSVKFKDGVMKHLPLYPDQYGACVIQLSVSGNLLLVSTLDRAFILDIVTYKLDQVGRKERKSGLYGGCIVENGPTLFIARPGLRIWTADELGRVLHTVAFKEALSLQQLPTITINSTPTSSPCYLRSWQFSTLHPMLDGKYVVTFQDNTVFVLDPLKGTVVGISAFKTNVKSVCTSGGFLYILCESKQKAIVRVAVHHSLVTLESERKGHSLSNRSSPCTSVRSSPLGSLESVVTDGMIIASENLDAGIKPVAPSHDLVHATIPTISVTRPEECLPVESNTELSAGCRSEDPTAATIGESCAGSEDPITATIGKSCAESEYPTAATVGESCAGSEDPITATIGKSCAESEYPTAATVGESCAGSEDPITATIGKSCAESEYPTAATVGESCAGSEDPITATIGKSCAESEYPTAATVGESCAGSEDSIAATIGESCAGSEDPITATIGESCAAGSEDPITATIGESRAGSEDLTAATVGELSVGCRSDDGEVIESPQHQVDENRVDSVLAGVEEVREHSRRVRMSQSSEENIVAGIKSHRKKRKGKSKKFSSASGSTSASLEKLADIAEDEIQELHLPISVEPVQVLATDQEASVVAESEKDGDSDLQLLQELVEEQSSAFPNVDVSTFQLIEKESGQQISTEVLESTLEESERNDSDNLIGSIAADTAINNNEAISDSTVAADVPVADTSSLHVTSSATGIPLGDNMSDNPLYDDTDEDQPSLNNPAEQESKLFTQSHHSLLQPALSDPLQEEEMLQTGTRPRHLNVQESVAKPDFSQHYRDDLNPGSNMRCQVTSWIAVDESMFEVSDSSHDSEPESGGGTEVTDSQVVDDFYQLCGNLVQTTGEGENQPLSPVPHSQFSQASISDSHSLSHTSRLCEAQEPETTPCSDQPLSDQSSEEQSMDIWVSVPLPSRHTLHSVSLSDALLWVVDTRGKVFYTTTTSRGRNWQHLKKTMQQVTSSPSGHVVWGVYHQNAYARLGIGMNPAGSTWNNITKNTSLAHKIKQVAVEENGIWAITLDNRVLFRKGVDERNPEGKVWQEVSYGMNFSFISCCKGFVWALTNAGKVFVRDGIVPSSLSGKKWTEIKSPRMSAVSITSEGVVWGINDEGSVGFRTGINSSRPGGRGPWWEVAVNSDTQPLSPLSSLWQVMSADGNHSFSSAVSSLVSMPHQHQVTTVSASSKGGVVVLEGGHRLYGCWRMTTGYHYTAACKDGDFQMKTWSRMAAGGTGLWFVRDDGDLYCLSPGAKLKRVEVPSCVELIGASSNCMWVISKDMVWSRQGMTAELPEGISFDYIELSTLLHNKKLRSVACGKKVAWGIDSSGVPHFRFGVHAREPGTGMSPAWVPVEDHPGPLLQIAVCPDDWLVWACDEDYNVYVRSGVTVDFPVGRKWTRIPKQKIKELAATSDRMYGLTPSGDLMCRYGVSENNVQGSFWRKMPGNYEHITTGTFGELWTLDKKGQVWKQEWKVIRVSDLNAESMLLDPESWEFL